MTHRAARLGLAASAAVALIAAAAVLPAAAQSKIYPSGTDCTKLVGNDKMNCEQQMKNTGSPDNANNPDNSSINTTNSPVYETPLPNAGTTSAPSSTSYPAAGEDCTKLVGNSKTECEQRSKNSPSPDNANNPDQTN